MVLNGDILEYENMVGEQGTNGVAITGGVEWLIFFLQMMVGPPLLRLSGGKPKGPSIMPMRLRSGVPFDRPTTLPEYENTREARRKVRVPSLPVAAAGAAWLTETINPSSSARNVPIEDIGRPMDGGKMLEWKNSLTKTYHTMHFFRMSNVLHTAQAGTSGKYIHRTGQGCGPHLYWIYANTLGGSTARNVNWNTPNYWDGGMFGDPSASAAGDPYTTPAKNFGLGAQGTIYIFVAHWPGTIMNPDILTQDSSSEYKYLEMADYTGQQQTTSNNVPRKWTAVFANTNWNYITIYQTSWRFDLTNFFPAPYVVEIQLFQFKADIDAMDYEKQCLAAFGGQHFGTSSYINQLNYIAMTDIKIIKSKRYKIPGMTTAVPTTAGYANMVESTSNNSRTVKWNIKKKYVLKRPVLTTYETTLSEKEIFTKYCDPQKQMYFRIMAWPEELLTCSQLSSGETVEFDKYQSLNVPNATTQNCTKVGNGVNCNIFKRSWFKLDETAANF